MSLISSSRKHVCSIYAGLEMAQKNLIRTSGGIGVQGVVVKRESITITRSKICSAE